MDAKRLRQLGLAVIWMMGAAGAACIDAPDDDSGLANDWVDELAPPPVHLLGGELPPDQVVPPEERVSNGNPILPPKWAFGVLYGSYYDQAKILDAMRRIRDGYAGDLMWIDSSWLSGTYDGDTGPRYICYQFDSQQFPDPGAMIGTLRDNHFHFGVWQWPWMDRGCNRYAYGRSHHYFVEDDDGDVIDAGGWHGNTFTGAFDYTNPGAVAWWNQHNRQLRDWGLDFLKLDTGGGYPSGGQLSDGNNNQGHYRSLYHRTAFALTATTNATVNGGRGFILTHTQSSPDNDQTPGMWTGDSKASWTGLKDEMKKAAKLNKSSNAAFWCGDTGGYNNTPSNELYIRWLEYTAFTPCQEFFGAKTNSTGNRFPWSFNSQAQQLFRQYTQLRYRLLPFRYSNAQIAYHESPVKYPVRWIGSTQIVVGNGDSELLVQPVTSQGATTAKVKLPSGASWIEYWTGSVKAGGSTATVDAPLDKVPIFIKAGSIIPMGPTLHWVDEVPADPLTLDIYPAGRTRYTLYEDDGISSGYLGGAYSTTRFTSDATGSRPTVRIDAQQTARYRYPGQLTARTYILKINQRGSAPASVTRDGAALPAVSAGDFEAAETGWYYQASAKIVWVKLRLASDTGTTVSL